MSRSILRSELAACLTAAALQLSIFSSAALAAGDAAAALRGGSRSAPAPALSIHRPGAPEARRLQRLERFFSTHSDRWEVRWDARTDRPHLIQGPGIALWPGNVETRLARVEQRLRRFLARHSELFDVPADQLRLDRRRSFGSGDGLWLVEFEQVHGGLPVVGARVFMRVNQGRLAQLGSDRLAAVELDLEPALTADQALGRASEAFGEKLARLSDGGLAIYPVAPANDAPGALYQGAPGQGVRHRLAWRLRVATAAGGAFDLAIDAHDGQLLESRDLVRSLGRVTGEVAPIRRDDPPRHVGLPWSRVMNAGVRYADHDGFYGYQGGAAWAGLEGLYATVVDGCGEARLGSADGDLDFGGGGADCQTPGFGGAGNTLAARTAYFYLSRAQQRAIDLLGQAPGPRNGLVARTNLAGGGCGAFYNGAAGTLDFERSASGCANPGELPGIVYHEWGHGVFESSGAPAADGASGEAAADTFSFLETGDACIGDGFRRGISCHNCSRSCTGVRDLAAFALGGGATLAAPDTVEDDLGLDCDRLGCPYAGDGADQYQGPMGYQAHCESQIASSANWDLSQRLRQVYGPERGAQLMAELWYQSLAAAGSAYRKVPGAALCHPDRQAVDGCGADNWYTVYLMVDDDDGDLSNGTPNGCLIWQAFDAHGIACGDEPPCHCAQPAVADAGPDLEVCSGEPVEIGTPARPGHAYTWSLVDGLAKEPPGGWNQARITIAPAETTTYKLVAQTSCDAAGDLVTVTATACDKPFDGDFESGGVGWQTGGLWHLTESSTCAAPGYASPVHAMYFGQDASCDYDAGGVAAGELISPRIARVGDDSHLVFDFARAVESGALDRDRAEVAIAAAGSSDWDPRWARDALDPSTGAWETSSAISLAPYAGQSIQVRFRFDSRDGEANGYAGWLIDDVAVVEQERAASSPPAITVLDPLDGGAYQACTCVPVSAYADDAEDGDLAAIVRWRSDRDGALGAGRSLAAALSVGSHELTATVTDHAGHVSSTTVSVTVEPAAGCDLSEWPPADPKLFCGDDE